MSDDASELEDQVKNVLRRVPNALDSAISEEFGCSVSDVERIREEFDEDVDISELNFGISFGHPYAISAQEKVLTTLDLTEGDIIQMSFESDGETNSAYGQIEKIPDENDTWWETEFHGVTYAAYYCFDEFSEIYQQEFSGIDIANDGTPDIEGQEEFHMFMEGVQAVSNDICETETFIIGAGLLEIGTDNRHIEDLVETPLFKLERDDIVGFIQGDGIEMIDWIPYEGEVDKPDSVHFAHYAESFDDRRLKRARETILDHSVYQADWNYTIPNFRTLVGPTAIGTSSPAIEVNEENLEIIPGKQRVAQLREEMDLDFEWFKEYVNDIAITDIGGRSSTSQEEDIERGSTEAEPPTVPHRVLEEDSTIIFLFDPVNVVLDVGENELVWRYPDDIGVLRDLVMKLTQDIEDRLDTQFSIGDAQEPQQPSLPESENWVLDTNAFYHEIIENEPSSILHTIFPNGCFYRNNIHIPWIIPFEINKHPDRRGATKADVKQAKSNLEQIRFLGELGFFDLQIDSRPDEIQVDVGHSDIADMHVLEYIQEEDHVLLTRDQDLQTISKLWDIPVRDLSMLAEVPNAPAPDQQLREEVLNKIGTRYQYESEILDAIRQHQNQQQTKDAQVEDSPTTGDERDELEQWRRQGDVTCAPKHEKSNGQAEENSAEGDSEPSGEDLLQYGQAEGVNLVPTSEAVEIIYEEWISDSDHLKYEFLNSLKQDLDMAGAELPVPTFHVPTQTVINSAQPGSQEPSEMNKKIYKLDSLENGNYESESLRIDDTDLSASITLAKENSWPVIASPEEDYLQTLGGALGVYIVTLPSGGGET